MTRVGIVTCIDYNTQNVSAAVKKAVDILGGIESFVKPGMRVLLKPNLLSARFPEDAVDTHPEVVRAVVRLVKGAGGVPVIGDSPGGYGNNIEEIFSKSGMRKIAQEEGAELARFKTSKFIEGFPISRLILDSDSIISIPKFKTHSITVLTAAIKNMYGAVVGPAKTACHAKAPREKEFAKIAAQIYGIAKPQLNIVDGIMAMEGDGPSSGTPRQMGLIMAGSDGVAIDACLARIMGIDPLDVLVTKEAYAMGLGEARMDRIEILGDDIESFITSDFKLPQTTLLKYIPHSVASSVASLIKFKPYIDEAVCTRCNLCKITCPVNCISISPEACDIDYKKCVRCLCCQEVCPYKAIGIKRNILTKMIWG
jgi:uncharacterized protein (DUF362 family)